MGKQENRRRPAVLLRCGTALMSALVALGLAEAGLRLAGFRAPQLLEPEAKRAYRHGPHESFVYRGYLPGTFVDFENPVRLNEWGFHERDYAADRPSPGAYRLMVLGDSYVAALSIPLERTFHEIVERKLAERDPMGCGAYEVIAFGQGARAQRDELAWLKTFGPKYRPDAVLLVFFCGNDVMENSPNLYRRAVAFGERYVKDVYPRKKEIFDRLLFTQRSRVNGLMAEALTTWIARHPKYLFPGADAGLFESPELGVYRSPPDADWAEAFNTTDELLRAVREECERQECPFLVACLQSPQAMGDSSAGLLRSRNAALDFEQPARWLRAWCDRNQVPLCDFQPALERAGLHRVFWRHDGHLNVRGNEAVADVLYDFIVRNSRPHAAGGQLGT